ncbi:conserved hypothetical protein [Burkholderiales bacterium 8X]|nr:conserved hypothetical protein [Burkholderiales bacterium 8X]
MAIHRMSSSRRRLQAWLQAALLLPAFLISIFSASPALAADNLLDARAGIASFASAPLGPVAGGWRFSSLPNKTPTRFDVVEVGGERVLKVEAADSYGNLVHATRVPLDRAPSLSWRWKVGEFVRDADLRTREGDDGAAKLCVFFDLPAERLPFVERTKLALARKTTGENVPSEALCYVWDAKVARGTTLVNAFTQRMRMIVVESGPATAAGGWLAERRDLLADYRLAFGDEAQGAMPDVVAVAISADADNTHGHGLAYFSDLRLQAGRLREASNSGFVPAEGRAGNGE